jgi:hypothetical protein
VPAGRHDVAARDGDVVDDREVREGRPLLPEPLLDSSPGTEAGLAGHPPRVHQDVWGGDLGERSEAMTAQHVLEPATDDGATIGWPQLRLSLRRVGEHLVEAGVLANPDDVSYLQRAELDQALAGRAPRGPAESDRLLPGEVLVAPTTSPA